MWGLYLDCAGPDFLGHSMLDALLWMLLGNSGNQ